MISAIPKVSGAVGRGRPERVVVSKSNEGSKNSSGFLLRTVETIGRLRGSIGKISGSARRTACGHNWMGPVDPGFPSDGGVPPSRVVACPRKASDC